MIEARALNVEKVREDFPILARRIHGHPLVYLDSAATSQKPAAVIDVMDDYYRRYNANPHRGVYAISEEATAAYESARHRVASFINAASPKEVIFCRNTTEAINLVRYSWGRANVHAGDRILLTEMEHHSNLVPWQLLAQEVAGDDQPDQGDRGGGAPSRCAGPDRRRPGGAAHAGRRPGSGRGLLCL